MKEAQLAKSKSHAGYKVSADAFVAGPHIYSDICELVCGAVYDYLYNEGFLDLPNDWRIVES